MEIAEATLVCPCGFKSTTKSGFTLHRKKCAAVDEKLPVDPKDLEQATALVKGEPPLTTSDRNAFARLIKARQEAMLSALTDELSGNPEQVIENLRRQIGITLSPAQIETLIKGVNDQINNTIDESLSDEKERIEIALSDLDDQYEEKQRTMKERHRKEWHDLAEEQKGERQRLKKQLRDSREKVISEKASDLRLKLGEYKLMLEKTRQLEAKVQADATSRVSILKTSRKRLEHIIQDAANRALEELWMTDSRSVAAELVKKIPTVSEALHQADSLDGFNELMKRLDPTMALPPPKVSTEEIKTIDVPVPSEDDREEHSWERDRRLRRERDSERDHDQIYDSPPQNSDNDEGDNDDDN